MFLCKRVRSEVGVDSVGVGGGEPGGPAGGALRLVVTCPSTSLPLALREWAGVFFSLARSAARRSSMLQIAGHSSSGRRLVGGEVAAVLGGPRGSVVQRLDRVGGAEVTRRRAGGKARKAVFLSQALSHVAAVCGCSRPGSDWRKAPGARRAASSSGAVQARAPGGGDPLAVPCGRRTARVARTGVDHAGGDHGVGPGRPGRPRAGRPARRSTRSARP